MLGPPATGWAAWARWPTAPPGRPTGPPARRPARTCAAACTPKRPVVGTDRARRRRRPHRAAAAGVQGVAQALRRLYARTPETSATPHTACTRLGVRCADSTEAELHRLAPTLQTWRSRLLACWSSAGRRGVSNGPTEVTSCLIRKVKRSGHGGFRNFHSYRLQLLPNVGPSTGAPSHARLRLPPIPRTPITLSGVEPPTLPAD